MNNNDQDARRIAEKLARASYGRLLAIVAARSGDLITAEDALSDAFAKALSHWPEHSVPDNPEAWLVVTARRRIGHVERHQAVQRNSEEVLNMVHQELTSETYRDLRDDRLRLLFVCAHPAISPAVRTPLMLQTVLGLDAERIGRAFLVPGPTMGQRLVRAKTKIRDASIPFEVPHKTKLAQRLNDVLRAIYGAFNTGWEDLPKAANTSEDLAEEAIFLAQILVGLLADEPEAMGLLALMLHSHARRSARRSKDGAFVPLSQQNPLLWDKTMAEAAETYLRRAAVLSRPGRYQTEAAIQSVHAGRLFQRDVSSTVLVRLYEVIVHQTESIGARVSLAAAHLSAESPGDAEKVLSRLPDERLGNYQPFWVVKARLAAALGEIIAAHEAYARALSLTEEEEIAAYLRDEKSRLPIQ